MHFLNNQMKERGKKPEVKVQIVQFSNKEIMFALIFE